MLPENFWFGVLGTLIYFAIAMVLLPIAFKIVDRIAPGHVTKQILGHEEGLEGKPNIALGIVVGCLLLGVCHIIASAIK